MKQYTYISLLYEGVMTSKLSEHREIIDKYAAQGWRYVDHIVTHQSSDGQYAKLDLIFEKDAEE